MIVDEIKKEITNILKKINIDFIDSDINVNILTNYKGNKLGDFTTNIAFVIGKKNNYNPLLLANKIVSMFHNPKIIKIEVIKPGFINFFVDKKSIFSIIREIIKNGRKYGSGKKKNKKINIEFVSANPTGELHIGHARGAAYGDSLARILIFSGYDVTREYYVNDAGNQIKKFSESVYYRYLSLFKKKIDPLKIEYKGNDVIKIAKKIKQKYKKKLISFSKKNINIISKESIKYELNNIIKTLKKFNVKFDIFTHEKDIIKSKNFKNIQNILGKYIYDKDGAKFIKTTSFFDDKDRVIVKKDGSFTYFYSDIAYHFDKVDRNFDKLIDILGADHHGYINRIKSVLMMKGKDEKIIDIKIIQMVRFIKDDKEYKMSKRTGEMVSLKDLNKEISMNSIRFFLISKSNNTHLDFDYSLAKKNDSDNPVYYILYAYVRLKKILLMAKKIKKNYSGDLLTNQEEREIVKSLYEFPQIIETISKNHDVNLVANYVFSLAKLIHSYYNKYRIIDNKNIELSSNRLGLVKATIIVLKNALNIIGIKTLNSM